jgi:hypothetical protein
MSDKSKRLKAKAPALTPEQIAEAKIAREKVVAEEKAERERVELYGASLPKMSDRQLRGELRRTIKREYAGKPPEPQAGLTILYSTVLLTVLENTQTKENPFAKLGAYPR